MKLFRRFAFVVAAGAMLTACSNHDFGGKENEDGIGKDGVFMALTLNPNGQGSTKSSTNGDNSSDGGVEVGTQKENQIITALIVLTDRDNNYIASASVPGTDNKGSITAGSVAGTTLYQAIAKFDKTELASYYDDGGDGNINVFVFANPTNALVTLIDDSDNAGSNTWVDEVCTLTSGSDNTLWNDEKGFLMSNLSIENRNLPTDIKEWINYNTPTKAFDLSGMNAPGTEGAVDNFTGRGAVRIQRMAARLDFRDGSQILSEGQPIGNGVIGQPFTYGVVKNVDGNVIVNCKLYAMALTNMNKSEYYLKRVSNNGRPTKNNSAGTDNGFLICGPEKMWTNGTGGNYVISPDWEAKYNVIKSNFSNYFFYPFFDSTGHVQRTGTGWDWIYCTNVVAGPSDNYGDKSFHVWRYLTENTIPAPTSNQVNSQSTGIVFKARLLPTDILKNSTDSWEQMLYEALAYADSSVGTGKLLHKNAETDPIIYSLSGNSLYVTWENVRAAALSEAGYDATKGQNQELDRNSPLYRIVYGTGGVGTVKNGDTVVYVDPLALDQNSPNYKWQAWQDNPGATTLSAFKSAATQAGFTLYQSSQDPQTNEWGYYCYYYYWNRHNDNLEDGVMGPMEFAVVRNNVYKLTVTNLRTLGHPRIPENDPDDPTPDTPDEKSEVYLTVTVDVVPWVVRINNIEF